MCNGCYGDRTPAKKTYAEMSPEERLDALEHKVGGHCGRNHYSQHCDLDTERRIRRDDGSILECHCPCFGCQIAKLKFPHKNDIREKRLAARAVSQ